MTDQEIIEWVADMWNQRVSGKTFETLGPLGWMDIAYGPNVNSVPDNWRMKPEVKVIDLSPLIDSGILCEFWSDEGSAKKMNFLLIIEVASNRSFFRCEVLGRFPNCTPLMNHIHYWAGSDQCPVPEGFEVRLHFRSGRQGNELCVESMTDLRWGHTDSDGDIIGIEFIGIKDGYTLGGDKQ